MITGSSLCIWTGLRTKELPCLFVFGCQANILRIIFHLVLNTHLFAELQSSAINININIHFMFPAICSKKICIAKQTRLFFTIIISKRYWEIKWSSGVFKSFERTCTTEMKSRNCLTSTTWVALLFQILENSGD